MPHSAPASKKSSTLLLLMTMTLLAVFPLDVVLPSFPALSSHFHTTPSEIAESVSIFAIGLAVSLLLIGPLSDRFGRKGYCWQASPCRQLAQRVVCSLRISPGFLAFAWSRPWGVGRLPCPRR